jgi:hypothetical protein
MSTFDTIKETDWVVGDTDQVLHHAANLKGCTQWVADRHGLKQPPRAQRTQTVGVKYLAVPDGTAYWAMNGAPTAREQGYDIPLPDIPETYGIAQGEAALVDHPADGPCLTWNSRGHIGRQPVPESKRGDVDGWAETTATRRLRSIGITTYLGRREMTA